MYPDVFGIAASSPAVVSALGSNPTRFWPFGTAPQNEQRPYAVHQLAYGTPENTLSCPPNTDLFGVQVDAYARSVTEARTVGAALRDAFEGAGNHVTAWNGESWEQATGLWRVSMTVEFWTDR